MPEDYSQGEPDHNRPNIPRPDPSTKTVEDIKVAIAQVRELLKMEITGIAGVINERLNSIEKRLDTGFVDSKQQVVTALAGVTEAGNAQVVKFDILERRVAALELAISSTSGRQIGGEHTGSIMTQVIMAALAAAGVLIAFITWTHVGTH